MILVLGGGFGLYGHLAALASSGHPVSTLVRYRPLVQSRPELAALDRRIEWVEDEDVAVRRAGAVVLARRPDDNEALVERLVANGQGGTLVIEKPIAPSPERAIAVAALLREATRHWAVPYLFLYCDWFDQLREHFSYDDATDATIEWSFRQSPRSRSWKRTADQGGGALAFYFIHCLAVAKALMPQADCRFLSVENPDGSSTLRLVCTHGHHRLSITFDLDRADLAFRVVVDGHTIVSDMTPFGAPAAPGSVDLRVPVLQRFYREAVFGREQQDASFHNAVNGLWREVERHVVA